jgi:hypothetical protein
MNERFAIGQFGRFEWTVKRETKVKGELITTHCPYIIEGAQVTDIDRSQVWIEDMLGVVYIAPRSAVYTPMAVNKIKAENAINL